MALVKVGEIGQERALAFTRYGKGRHSSGLNVGDGLSCALAERLKVPLLFVGNDCNHTDLEAALG